MPALTPNDWTRALNEAFRPLFGAVTISYVFVASPSEGADVLLLTKRPPEPQDIQLPGRQRLRVRAKVRAAGRSSPITEVINYQLAYDDGALGNPGAQAQDPWLLRYEQHARGNFRWPHLHVRSARNRHRGHKPAHIPTRLCSPPDIIEQLLYEFVQPALRRSGFRTTS